MDGYYHRSPGVASRVVDGEAFLIKMPDNVLFVLNRAASRIWVDADGVRPGRNLAGGRDPEAHAAFLDEMVGLGLLQRSSSPREEADAFPQEVVWPAAEDFRERPEIRSSETVEAIGGCGADPACVPPFSGG